MRFTTSLLRRLKKKATTWVSSTRRHNLIPHQIVKIAPKTPKEFGGSNQSLENRQKQYNGQKRKTIQRGVLKQYLKLMFLQVFFTMKLCKVASIESVWFVFESPVKCCEQVLIVPLFMSLCPPPATWGRKKGRKVWFFSRFWHIGPQWEACTTGY